VSAAGAFAGSCANSMRTANHNHWFTLRHILAFGREHFDHDADNRLQYGADFEVVRRQETQHMRRMEIASSSSIPLGDRTWHRLVTASATELERSIVLVGALNGASQAYETTETMSGRIPSEPGLNERSGCRLPRFLLLERRIARR